MIQNLLQVINEKREEMYLIQTQIDISQKELRHWVYDIDNIKILPLIQVYNKIYHTFNYLF